MQWQLADEEDDEYCAEEGADGAGAEEDEKKMRISEEDKKKRRIYERKLQNFRSSQATFYAEGCTDL